MKLDFKYLCFLFILAIASIGCSDDDDTVDPTPEPTFTGAVYAMNNDDSDNRIIAYGQNEDGTLTLLGSISTGGTGTGPNNVASGPGANTIDPLASNYAIGMSEDNSVLFAVNAGSNELSSFSVNDDLSLTLISTVDTRGTDPVSLSVSGNAVFVANTNEGMGSIAAFTFSSNGTLTDNTSSDRSISGRPAAIMATADNNFLAIAEVNTNTIQMFGISGGNLSSEPVGYNYDTPAEGRNVANPFGLYTFATGGTQVVGIGEARVFSQDGELGPQTSSLSTFSVASDGTLTPLSLDVRTDSDNDDTVGPITSCWLVLDSDSNNLYTVNTNNNSISSFNVANDGKVTLNESLAFQEEGDFEEDGLTDAVVVGDVLYQLEAASGAVVALSISSTGQLTEIDRDTDLNTIGGNQGITGFTR